MDISIATFTTVGTRPVNEDYLLTRQDGARCMIALADGLGGHGMGDEASKLACEVAIEAMRAEPEFSDDDFRRVYDACQDRLLEKQKELHAAGKMRTTLNLLCLEGGAAYWSHIGDSRTYYFKDRKLVRRTFDHSVPQMLVAAGKITEAEIRFHEDRNRLLRVLGVAEMRPSFEAEMPVSLTGDQQFLLCSDGFWERISEEQMIWCLEDADDPQFWLDNMAELVSRNSRDKESDNQTAVAVWIK